MVICAFTMKPDFNWPCTNQLCYILVMHNKPLTYTLCPCMITFRGVHDHWPIKPYLYCAGCSYPVYDSVSSNKCLEANVTIYLGFSRCQNSNCGSKLPNNSAATVLPSECRILSWNDTPALGVCVTQSGGRQWTSFLELQGCRKALLRQ